MNAALKSLLMIGIVLEVAAESPTIIGEVGRKISDHEVADIARIASTNGTKPWLLIAQPGQLAGFEYVHVFCAPTISTREIRRGPMALVSRKSLSSNRTLEAWNLDGRGEYAQVVISGRDMARIDGEQDLNRPFQVMGKFSNEELGSIVKFLRSSPLWMADSGERTRIEGTWPVKSIRREKDASVVISLRKDNWSGQEVRLRPEGKKWVIIGIGFWIV